MHHKQEDDAVKHGGDGALEDEAEGHDCCCHCCPQMRHIHLKRQENFTVFSNYSGSLLRRQQRRKGAEGR